ncbi:366504d1-aee1-4813-8cd2-6a9882f1a888 [Thermothielavioides terrestris]|uniref:366504d1-aee1-4813-8cd2-6a9882f1a888 n=1 Tax=Thermothielavioides terrestris TaxID=2587410 RepID=A0A3S4ATH7_9PEZI|nr:366504d1-aee1-4813-8cd2-6a9882f1a888 [Thermothielavioides terrestris]
MPTSPFNLQQDPTHWSVMPELTQSADAARGPLNTWIIEDVQVRKVFHIDQPDGPSSYMPSPPPLRPPNTNTPTAAASGTIPSAFPTPSGRNNNSSTKCRTTSTPGAIPPTGSCTVCKDHHFHPARAALHPQIPTANNADRTTTTSRVASATLGLDPSSYYRDRVQDATDSLERQALREQQRREAELREERRARLELARQRERERLEKERAAAVAEEVRRVRERLERERAEAAERERAVREQTAREAELKTQTKQRELEAAAARARRARELEDAAVARAVEESILSEAARSLKAAAEEEERERKRVAAAAAAAARERAMMEAEAVAMEGRLWRWVEGKQEWGGPRMAGGLAEHCGLFGSALRPLGPRLAGVWTLDDHGEKHTPSSPSAASPLTGCAGHKGPVRQSSESTWADSPTSISSGPTLRAGSSASDACGFGPWDRDIDIGRLGETEAHIRCNGREDGRGWRETTTERRETIICREEGRNGVGCCCRDVSKPTSGFL